MPSMEINLNRNAEPRVLIYKWCNHKHTPAPQKVVMNTIGGAKLLNCEGCIENCAIEDELFNDM